jgi:predicted nucleic acid-binding protein
MTPPTVLLDRSFLEALIDSSHEAHAAARACYERLVNGYERHEHRLRARNDHLASVDRPTHADLLAPVEAIHVVKQYRRQAERLGSDLEPDVAVTLVVMRRERIERIATLDPFFDTLDVTVER